MLFLLSAVAAAVVVVVVVVAVVVVVSVSVSVSGAVGCLFELRVWKQQKQTDCNKVGVVVVRLALVSGAFRAAASQSAGKRARERERLPGEWSSQASRLSDWLTASRSRVASLESKSGVCCCCCCRSLKLIAARKLLAR